MSLVKALPLVGPVDFFLLYNFLMLSLSSLSVSMSLQGQEAESAVVFPSIARLVRDQFAGA